MPRIVPQPFIILPSGRFVEIHTWRFPDFDAAAVAAMQNGHDMAIMVHSERMTIPALDRLEQWMNSPQADLYWIITRGSPVRELRGSPEAGKISLAIAKLRREII